MILGTFILIVGALALMLGGALWIYAYAGHRREDAPAFVAIGVAILLILIMFPAIVLRNVDFTIDARAYLEFFQTWCQFGYAGREGFTFETSMALINTAMLGACDPALLTAAWAGIICVLILASPAPLRSRLLFLGAFLFSMPGIEMLTNVMRQGIAASFLVCALGFLKKSRLMAMLLASLAMLFHISSIMFIGAWWLARQRYRYVAMVLGVLALLGVFLNNPPQFALNAYPPLRYVAIYAQIENFDAFIRAIVLLNIAAVALLPIFVDRDVKFEWGAIAEGDSAFLVKLTLICILASVLPGFGYRFAYGVFPIVLWTILDTGDKSGRRFPFVLIINMLVLIAWSFGSSYMRSVAFL